MKIAIIGAGFSGMLAAYLLEKQNIEVTVYEKEQHIGGHCRTLTSKGVYTELGTVLFFTKHIKKLLLELKVDYTERFTYRNFLDKDFNSVEHISRENAALLMDEFKKLSEVLMPYEEALSSLDYNYIPEELLLPLCQFLRKHDLQLICQILTPPLSSFGFGDICHVQAYYAFKSFRIDTILSFIRGDKFLFIKKGTSELIKRLGHEITDIRYNIEVKNIEAHGEKVKVESDYSSDYYDRVLITTKLPNEVIKDSLYNRLMQKIDTNPYVTCAYEVENKNLVTTYFKHNMGKKGKVQFFNTFKHNNRTVLVTYTYGKISKELVESVTKDLKQCGIEPKHLITTKQWHIFPYLKTTHLTSDFYGDIAKRQEESNIRLIGSLVCEPSLSSLYRSISHTIKGIVKESKQK